MRTSSILLLAASRSDSTKSPPRSLMNFADAFMYVRGSLWARLRNVFVKRDSVSKASTTMLIRGGGVLRRSEGKSGEGGNEVLKL